MTTVAALYVDPRGVYADLPGVEVWDEARDARRYAGPWPVVAHPPGPWPVVAHPPCNRWARLASAETRGQDGGCFRAALAAVRRYGGVLEHPADSFAFRDFWLPVPRVDGWTESLFDAGMTCEVDQWHFGFPTRKRTWLYYVGSEPPPELDHSRPRNLRGCDALHSSVRSRTPPAFRDVLLAMARSARPLEPFVSPQYASRP